MLNNAIIYNHIKNLFSKIKNNLFINHSKKLYIIQDLTTRHEKSKRLYIHQNISTINEIVCKQKYKVDHAHRLLLFLSHILIVLFSDS